MSRPKAMLKQSKHPKKKDRLPETADDFQSAGVDFEDAAGKWRAGDAVKSLRFFMRAIDVYDEGLKKYPRSLDLAYNKARVQLEIATHPILVRQLQAPLLSVLEEALASHHYALQLEPENTDALFNTSQVLTTIAEEIGKTNGSAEVHAIKVLQEAVQLQEQCLLLQEAQYEENLKQRALMEEQLKEQLPDQASMADDNHLADDRSESSSARGQTEDQYFTVEEEVTQETLVDTALAELGTLTTLCSILNASLDVSDNMLSNIERASSALLNDKLPKYLPELPTKWEEVALAKANMLSALLEAGFRKKQIDAHTYKQELDMLFTTPEMNISSNFVGLVAYGRALIAYSYAIAEDGEPDTQNRASRIWNSLNLASSRLATASKLPDIPSHEAPDPHFLRADCALLQHALGQPPTSYASAMANAALLLKNAEIFYRNASKLSLDPAQKQTAAFRSWVVAAWQNQAWASVNSGFENQGVDWVQQQLLDMQSDNLLVGFGES